MKDCYYDRGLHLILLYDPSQSYILKLRDRGPATALRRLPYDMWCVNFVGSLKSGHFSSLLPEVSRGSHAQ